MKTNVERQLTALRKKHKAKRNWEGIPYVAIILKWDYDNVTFNLSKPECVEAGLK